MKVILIIFYLYFSDAQGGHTQTVVFTETINGFSSMENCQLAAAKINGYSTVRSVCIEVK